jgi:glycosyltransferase involved in cell wall biosynthesis
MVFVSFVLPAYKKRFFRQAIDSILAQSYTNFELIIVDDASPENLEEVVSEYTDSRITYYRNEQNIGGKSLVKQWNHCIQYAKGDYLVLAADDDLYHPEFLSKCVTLAEKYPQVDLIRTGAEQIDENNRLIGIDGILPEYCSKYQYVYCWLKATVFTCIGNYLFKTAVIQQKKFIDFPFALGSDTASTINMAENGVTNTAEMLFRFRISPIHLSSNRGILKEKQEAITLLFEFIRKLNYSLPANPYDRFCYDQIQWNSLYTKCKYDYYNLVIKYLPLSNIGWISNCKLLTAKDKLLMAVRFILRKLI